MLDRTRTYMPQSNSSNLAQRDLGMSFLLPQEDKLGEIVKRPGLLKVIPF